MAIDIILTNTGDVPIYQQIVDQIKGAVLRGELGADEPLPSIRLLAKELQISVITTKRAYEELEKDGLIYTIPGKGSFVAGVDQRRLNESKEKLVEEKIKEVIDVAERLVVSRDDLRVIFNRAMEEER